jgi:hypothetical protein
MGWLHRFFKHDAAEKSLSRPDFATSPWVDIDFSGNRIKFRDPKHSANYPINARPHDLDIYDDANFHEWAGSRSHEFYVKGWNFWDRPAKKNVGGVGVSGVIFNFKTTKPRAFNAFRREHLCQDILEICHDAWGEKNNAPALGDIGNGRYQYPVTSDQITGKSINGLYWYCASAQQKGHPPEIEYYLPLSAKHSILLHFDYYAYGDFDYYDPSLGLEELCQAVMEEFMQHFYVELSAQSLAEKQHAEHLSNKAAEKG